MRTILLVEDDPNDIELTIKALSDFNAANEIVVVRDGEEAVEYLLCRGDFSGRVQGNPAVILLDLKLPKVSGLEALKQIREAEHLRLIPVVVLTSSREEKDLKEAYRLGANAYVVKPVDFHQFAETVRQAGTFWTVVNEPPPDQAVRRP